MVFKFRIPAEQMVWACDGEIFGTGNAFQAAFPPGTYNTSLTAVDCDEMAGKTSVMIEVTASCLYGTEPDQDVDGFKHQSTMIPASAG